MSEKTVSEMSIYRHFKGGYFLVTAVAKDCNDPKQQNVIYVSLSDGETYSRSLEDFCSLVPEDKTKDNITGQLYRFCRVDRFGDVLANASTDSLVVELSNRSDNPFAGSCPDSIFRDEYCVGKVINDINAFDEPYEDFDIFYVTEDLQKAKEKLLKYTSSVILRRLLVFFDM